jgi:ribulose bisphosphate carboxylase small subunit
LNGAARLILFGLMPPLQSAVWERNLALLRCNGTLLALHYTRMQISKDVDLPILIGYNLSSWTGFARRSRTGYWTSLKETRKLHERRAKGALKSTPMHQLRTGSNPTFERYLKENAK